jgi:predicted restriction endonuclease
MSDWSWKQAVAECVLNIVNNRTSAIFTINDVYLHLNEFSQRFPKNHHIQEKIRQTLQRLRDDSFLSFQGGGQYVLNLSNQELEAEPAPLRARGVELPITKQVVRNLRLRSTILGAEIKRRYSYTCQVCNTSVPLRDNRRYAEAHHLWPLGSPHFGPDIPNNIIVLCPNHHVMFDRGAATIVPDTLSIRHVLKGVFSKETRLHLEAWHPLGQKYLLYHHYKIFGGSSIDSVARG